MADLKRVHPIVEAGLRTAALLGAAVRALALVPSGKPTRFWDDLQLAMEDANVEARTDVFDRVVEAMRKESDGADGYFVLQEDMNVVVEHIATVYGDQPWARPAADVVGRFSVEESPEYLVWNSLLVSMYSSFESLVLAIHGAHLRSHPEQLKSKQISGDQLFSSSTREDAIAQLVRQGTRDFAFKSLADQLRWFKTHFGDRYEYAHERWTDIVEVKARRDTIVHEGPFVNRDYQETMRTRGVDTKLRNPFVTDHAYLQRTADLLGLASVSLVLDSGRIWDDGDRVTRSYFLQHAQSEFVAARLWASTRLVAQSIIDWIDSQDDYALWVDLEDIAIVNRALADRECGVSKASNSAALSEMSSRPGIDPLLRLCVLSVNGDSRVDDCFDEIVSTDGIPISYLVDWPALDGLINTDHLMSLTDSDGSSPRRSSRLQLPRDWRSRATAPDD